MNNKAIPVCCHCKKEVVENVVEHKHFWYCRRCKIEVDDTGWEIGTFRIDESTPKDDPPLDKDFDLQLYEEDEFLFF